MQLTVTFTADKICLPIATSETLQGLIYRALSTDSAYSHFVHNVGKTFGGRAFKLFCFSELKGKHFVREKQIIYLSKVTLTIRSIDAYFIQVLFSYFSSAKNLRLGDNTVEVCDLKLSDRHIFSDSIRVQTLSPITVYLTKDDGHTEYFTPEDERFYRSVENNARRKWISYHGSDEGFSLQISPAGGTGYTRRATRFKNTFITAWHGTFVLTGNPATLDFLYHTGLGSKNSQGFGMFTEICR